MDQNELIEVKRLARMQEAYIKELERTVINGNERRDAMLAEIAKLKAAVPAPKEAKNGKKK